MQVLKVMKLADKLAKDMSEDIFKGRISATSCISMNSALQISAEIIYNSWQRKWECDSASFHTRQLVSRVGTRLVFPDDPDTLVSYCRLLLGDTMLKDDSFRTGTSDSPICDCGIEREMADHFLLRCTDVADIQSQISHEELCI